MILWVIRDRPIRPQRRPLSALVQKRTRVQLDCPLCTDFVAKVGGPLELRNFRIQCARRLNQSCAAGLFFKSMLRVGMRKLFLQQYLPQADSCTAAKSRKFNGSIHGALELRHHLFGIAILAQLPSDEVLDSAYEWLRRRRRELCRTRSPARIAFHRCKCRIALRFGAINGL